MLIALLILSLLLVGCSSPPAAAPGPADAPKAPETVYVTIGTAGVGGTNYPTGLALARIWNENVPQVKAVAIATNGSPHNIDLLRTVEIEAAVSRQIQGHLARTGKEPYTEKNEWLVAISGGVMGDAKQIVVLKDSGIETIADMKGKKVAVGPVGSGGEVDARETLAGAGLTYDDIKPQYIEVAQAAEMMQDGLVDAAILGLTVGSSAIQELMMGGKAKLIGIDDATFAKMKENNEFLNRTTIPAGSYPNQDEDIVTAGAPFDTIIARSDKLPEGTVYLMTKAMYENAAEIQAVASGLKGFGPNLVQEESEMLIPYHPETKKYFQEQGWIK